MDNTEFVDRLETIAKVLEKLPNELFKAAKPAVSSAERSEVMVRARAQLKVYEEFLPTISEGRRESAAARCSRAVTNIQRHLETLEKLG